MGDATGDLRVGNETPHPPTPSPAEKDAGIVFQSIVDTEKDAGILFQSIVDTEKDAGILFQSIVDTEKDAGIVFQSEYLDSIMTLCSLFKTSSM